MTPTNEIIFRNLFIKIRQDAFNSKEDAISMSPWKWRHMESLQASVNVMEQYDEKETYSFISKIQENRRINIYENERHSIDTSIETLKLLNIIIFNITQIETNVISVPGIISLGLYLREKGHLVDFVKLDEWIKALRIKKMTSLIGSFLIQLLNFEKNEVPFLYSEDSNAEIMMYDQLFINKKKDFFSQFCRILKYSKYGCAGYLRTKTNSLLENIEE